MFNFIKKHLKKIYNAFTGKLQSLFSRTTIDEQALKELEVLLIEADTGAKTTRTIINKLKERAAQGKLESGSDLQASLEESLLNLLTTKPANHEADVYLLVGINGSGKTTFASKLTYKLKNEGKKVLLVAADTFRAAATEQLTEWATRTNTAIVTGKTNQDPASVVYAGCDTFKNDNHDVMIVDTAGRLQTKVNLMKELEKIKRSLNKQLPDANIKTLLTVDAMLGQNSFEQAKLFHESTQLDGIVLTKIDGTGKGGIVFSIVQELGIPVAYISFGEQLEQCKQFDAREFVTELLSK